MKRDSIRVSEEVAQALAEKRPVVALESSVLAQGLPRPHNVESTRACQQAIREAGAVPAVTGFVAGKPSAGMSDDEIEQLIDPANLALKVGVRDAAMAVSLGRWGATTVSGTCAIADALGIELFATGGIGGVHRDAERTFDISQDLPTIARCRVAVVTAGAKAILDLPRTLEALETLGVPVVGYRTSEMPAFYTSRSGLELEHRVESADEAAHMLRARWDTLGEGGVVVANPVPAEAEADRGSIDQAITTALLEATARGIRGKALTPFLLSAIARETGGESMQANLALLVNNASLAAQIAVALAEARRR